MLRHEECTRESPDDPERRSGSSLLRQAPLARAALSRITRYDEALLPFAEFESGTQALVEFTDPSFRHHATLLRRSGAANALVKRPIVVDDVCHARVYYICTLRDAKESSSLHRRSLE